jgi:hypothetical protein
MDFICKLYELPESCQRFVLVFLPVFDTFSLIFIANFGGIGFLEAVGAILGSVML